MKLKNILKDLNEDILLQKSKLFIIEQDINDDDEENQEFIFGEPEQEGGINIPAGDAPAEEPEVPEAPPVEQPEPQQAEEPAPEAAAQPGQEMNDEDALQIINKEILQKPKKEKFSPLDELKRKWRQEFPGLTDVDANNAINNFNLRRNGLRPYNTAPGVRNTPEVVSLKHRFPNFPAHDVSKLRDIQTYRWEQLEFLLDNFTTQEDRAIEEMSIKGDSPKEKLQYALKQWENPYNRVLRVKSYDRATGRNGYLSVYKIEGQDESVTLGQLQNYLVKRFGGSNWCITNPTSTMYSSYRKDRSFFFIRDTSKPVQDLKYIAAIQPRKDEYGSLNSYPFFLTMRSNSPSSESVTWAELVRRWPALQGHEDIFKFFGPTTKEMIKDGLSHINFVEGDPNNLAAQTTKIKRMFIRADNLISSPIAFESLPDTDPFDLQREYVERTSRGDYHLRFRCADPDNPFGMLNVLRSSDLKFLDWRLKNQIGILDGVIAIKQSIIAAKFDPQYLEPAKKIQLVQSKAQLGLFGVFDFETMDIIKPLEYGYFKNKGAMKSLANRNKEAFQLQKFESFHDPNDYFYWLMPLNSLRKIQKDGSHNPNFLHGIYLDGDDGDRLLSSGEYIRI